VGSNPAPGTLLFLDERDFIDDLCDAKDMRSSADYGMVHYKEGSRTRIINAD
jgi:hypothetical protein